MTKLMMAGDWELINFAKIRIYGPYTKTKPLRNHLLIYWGHPWFCHHRIAVAQGFRYG